jgi:hypothetical protein
VEQVVRVVRVSDVPGTGLGGGHSRWGRVEAHAHAASGIGRDQADGAGEGSDRQPQRLEGGFQGEIVKGIAQRHQFTPSSM